MSAIALSVVRKPARQIPTTERPQLLAQRSKRLCSGIEELKLARPDQKFHWKCQYPARSNAALSVADFAVLEKPRPMSRRDKRPCAVIGNIKLDHPRHEFLREYHYLAGDIALSDACQTTILQSLYGLPPRGNPLCDSIQNSKTPSPNQKFQ